MRDPRLRSPIHPPLITVAFDHSGGDDDTRGWFGRHCRIVFPFTVCAALPLFYYDFRHDGPLVLAIVGINIIVAGLRVLLWDSGSKNTERERLGAPRSGSPARAGARAGLRKRRLA